MLNKPKTKQTCSDDQSVAPKDTALTFEEAMTELEGIVDRLEQDELTLDGALTFFERGISLLRTCDTHLNLVRGKITELFKSENGVFAEKILGTSLESFLNEENNHA